MFSRPNNLAPRALLVLEPGVVAAGSQAVAALQNQALGPRDIGFVRTLRMSVTDHCNLRCVYCMPADGVDWMPRGEQLTCDEFAAIGRAAIELGVRHFKLTGGEPLVRRDLPELTARLRELPGCGEISLTTNGILLERLAPDLAAAGVRRVTVSLDSLRADRFRRITQRGELAQVWRGVEAAEAYGLGPVKLNVVVMREHNFDEVCDFAALSLNSPRTIRFIEYMPLGQADVQRGPDPFVPYAAIRERIERGFGPLVPAEPDHGHGPARVFRVPGAAGRIGFIHAMSAPFCATCNRLRLTSEGRLRACLFDGGEIDLRPRLRPAIDAARLRAAFVECVRLRPQQHSAHGNRAMSQVGG
jgi:cyclic pyranopterin phosphate synthase